MSDSEPLEKALAYCAFYARYPKDEPDVKTRIHRRITGKANEVVELVDELKVLVALIVEEDKRSKYYEKLPWWANSNDRPHSLDGYLQPTAFGYYTIAEAVNLIHTELKEIKKGIDLPYNEKMKSYYLKKPGVVYREAVNILRQIV